MSQFFFCGRIQRMKLGRCSSDDFISLSNLSTLSGAGLCLYPGFSVNLAAGYFMDYRKMKERLMRVKSV